jgi:hypothetical protein
VRTEGVAVDGIGVHWQPTWTTGIRVSGLVAWYLLNLEVLLGTIAAGGMARLFVRPQLKFRLHSLVSWVLLVMVLVHATTIVLSHYHPDGVVWTLSFVTEIGWGTLARNAAVIAMDLLFVIVLLSILRAWVPKKVWIRLHRVIPFVILVLATIHGLGAGTDSMDPQIIYPAIVTLTLLPCILIARRYAVHARAVAQQAREYKGLHYRKR